MSFVLQRSLFHYRAQSRWIAQFSGRENGRTSGLLGRLRGSWVQIPTGVTVIVLAVVQWRRFTRAPDHDLSVARDWEITCYKAMPLRSFSRMFGWASETQLPVKARAHIYSWYARAFGVDLAEMASPIDSYPCLASFFTRSLKPGLRPIDTAHHVVSPCDGTVLNSGRLQSWHVEQVKGVTYSLKAFLGEPTWPRKDSNNNSFVKPVKHVVSGGGGDDGWSEYKRELLHNPENELYQCVLYLAPGDYHRFHSPVDWSVTFRRHFQGELLSVNPVIARWIPDLFALNERAVYVGSWEHGYFSMTAVGATNVGSIRIYQDESLHTNTRKWAKGVRHKETTLDLSWKKGEEIGEFRMGSTLVLVFEAPPGLDLSWAAPGTRIRVGRPLTNLAASQ